MSPISTSTRPYFLDFVVPTKDLIFEGRGRNREFLRHYPNLGPRFREPSGLFDDRRNSDDDYILALRPTDFADGYGIKTTRERERGGGVG